MSYEGREVYICQSGHLYITEAQAVYYDRCETPDRCEYCGASFEYVGPVDDTNGEACCAFKLQKIEEGFLKSKISNGVKYVEQKPSRYSVIKTEEWWNFDTQEQIKV